MSTDDLRFLEPERAAVAGTTCREMTVRTPQGQVLGQLQGFVVDPAARRVHFLVVRTTGMLARPVLVPFGAVRINLQERAVEVLDREALRRARAFAPRRFPSFSDQDLLAAMFRRRSAA